LSDGTLNPPCEPGTFEYRVEVDFPITSVTVTVAATVPTALVKIDGAEMRPGETSSPILLAVSTTKTIPVSISRPDGGELQEYFVYVLRRADARLSALTATTGVLSPAFDAETLDYSLTL